MNVHPIGQHFSTCHGPDDCQEYRSILSMTPNEFVAWIKQDRARYAAAAPAVRRHVAVLRHAIDGARYAPPNPYSKGLDALRGSDTITPSEIAAIARRADPRGPDDFRPPNPYDAPLALRKIQENR